MAKLVEILARKIEKFPKGLQRLSQRESGLIVAAGGYGYTQEVAIFDIAEDRETAVVTRAQWEAERARIANDELIEDPFPDTPDEALKRAANRKATQEAREIAKGGYAGSAPVSCAEGEEVFTPSREEQELADIACGKRRKEDQALWDRVLLQQLDKMTKLESLYKGEFDDCVAIAFERTERIMAERAKRLKGV